MLQHSGVDGIAQRPLEPVGADARLVNDIHLPDHAVDVRLQLVADAMPVEVLQDVGFHLQLGRADEEDLHPFEFCQQVSQGTDGAAAIKFPNEGHAQSIERTFAVNRVQIEQGLRGMLAARAVACVDDRHRRDLGRAARSARLMMANHDDVAIAANDADGILHLFGFDLGGERASMFGGEHASAQPVHGRFKAEARPGGRLIEQAGENSILVVQRSAARHNSLHQPRPVEQLHQQWNGELLRLDNVLQTHTGTSWLGFLQSSGSVCR